MMRIFPLLALLGVSLATVPAQAEQRRGEQRDARAQLAAGRVMSLREIEQRVLPRMRGREYLGPDYDPQAQVYRLKFIERGRVTFVDIDATTGRVLGER